RTLSVRGVPLPALGKIFACRTTVLRGDGEESVMQSFLSCQDTLLRTPPGPPTQAGTEGTVLAGPFELRRCIARGGRGVVFEAEHRRLRAGVAVKVLLGPVPDAEERIRREVLLARAVAHPNVCRVYELFGHPSELGQILFLVMELLEGETLTSAIAR